VQSTTTINFNTITILFHIVSFIFLSFFKGHTQTYQFSLYEESTPKIARKPARPILMGPGNDLYTSVTPTPDVTSPAKGGKVAPGRIMGTQPDVNDQRDQQ
jgi:hypothetical protein